MKRMALTALALIGVFVALYLTLYKLGMIGTLSCGTGGCERVNTSHWAQFLGIPVAVWGLGFYIVTFVLAFASTTPRLAGHAGLSALLTLICGAGVLFSAWLTYLELFVIHAICRYCVASAIIVLLMFVISWLDWRETRAIPRPITPA
jgi:uncharacterized membrane protein